MDKKTSTVLLILLIIYCISPVDFVPGPVDDLLLCVAYYITNRKSISQSET